SLYIPGSKSLEVSLGIPHVLSAKGSRKGHSPRLRPLNFLLLDGKSSLQEDFNYLLSFLKDFLSCVPPYNDIINELQVFWSPTFLQCSMDQSMANGGAVFPPLGQLIPGVLDTPPSECKLWPALWCYWNREKRVSNVSRG
ncbi:unnamed protein product, partial [Bubo scandiacus]